MHRRVVRAVAAVLLVVLAGAAGATAVDDGGVSRPSLGPGTVTSAADGPTVVSAQGFHYVGSDETNEKKPPRLLGVGQTAKTKWIYDGGGQGAAWFYDVDPLPDGDLLVTTISQKDTVVLRLDRSTREVVWRERLDPTDTHDVDLLPNGDLVVAHMRAYDADRGVSDDRVFVYDRDREEVTWEWQIRNHFPNDTDGGFRGDWSHVNDVDPVDGGEAFLVSLRNFDQVVLVDRETKAIEWRLGRDDDHDVLFEQHNPDLLSGPNGTPTVLVADSENDRVVEYARRADGWERTWTLRGNMSWPRDADRLPNGNTLVVDSLHQRVIEVTPTGEVVWEYHATWGPYDAERVRHGDGSNGPTMTEVGTTGTYRLHGGQSEIAASVGPAEWAALRLSGTPLGGAAADLSTKWSHVVPWIRPVWLPPWGFAYLLVAAVVVVAWGGVEAWWSRRRIGSGIRKAGAAVRRALGRDRARQ